MKCAQLSSARRRAKLNHLALRDGLQCAHCERVVRITYEAVTCSPDRATLDHVIPRSQGGSNHVNNLKIACHDCNWLRMDIPFEIFGGLRAVLLPAVGWQEQFREAA